MLLKRITLHAMAIFILLPTTAYTIFGSGIFIPFFFSALRGDPYAKLPLGLLAGAISILGCIGVVTLWVLYVHYFRTNKLPKYKKLAWAGLAAGVMAYLLLVFGITEFSPLARLIFACPLLAAAFFGYRLLAPENKSNTST
jgi:hypothetical protein